MGNYLQANDQLMFHIVTLTASWNILSNISMYAALYKHTVAGYYTHAILSWLIIILTLVSALFYLIPHGLPTQCHISNQVDCDPFQFPLGIQGSILLLWIAVQVFSGIFCRAWQENPKARSLSVIRARHFHWYSGYFIMLLGKVNCFVHWRDAPEVWGPLIGWEVITIALYIKRKWFFNKLEYTVVEPQIAEAVEEIPKIKYIEHLQKGKGDYVVFADYVYDITPLTTLHPAGWEIMEAVKGREIDRFIYGMYAAESLPEVPVFSHPVDSFRLVDAPVAKIENPNPYSNMEDLNDCYLSYKEMVCEKTQIYILGFTSLSGKDFVYNGYSTISQIGQYFSLTINKKTTRLYTTVNCLAMSNRKLMEKIIARYPLEHSTTQVLPDVIPEMKFKMSSVGDRSDKPISEKRLSVLDDDEADIVVPIMIRKYDAGVLTPQLVADTENEELTISTTRGQGLKLDMLPAGKIVMIAGGTGFYPYMDLVDLLYKRKVLREERVSATEAAKIKKLNPILQGEFLEDFTFLLYLALNTRDDLHPMSLYQLHVLCEDRDFQCVVRMRDGKEDFRKAYPNFSLTNSKFDDLVLPDMKNELTSKTFICGPPMMNIAIMDLIKANKIPEDKYEMV